MPKWGNENMLFAALESVLNNKFFPPVTNRRSWASVGLGKRDMRVITNSCGVCMRRTCMSSPASELGKEKTVLR